MVKVLLSLKWRYFLASFKGNAWVIVGAIFGSLYLLGALVGWGVFASTQGAHEGIDPVTAMLLVGTGVLLALLWWILPIFASGTDATLDPDHLAPYPLKTKDIQLGQLLGGLIGLPGIATVLFSAVTALLLWRHPVSLVIYVLMIPLGLALVLTVSRIISLLAIEISSIPGVKQGLIIVGFLLMMGAGPLVAGLALGLGEAWDALPSAMKVLSWTPLGAPFAVASAVYMGHWGKALLFLVLSLIYLALSWVIWTKLLNRAMSRIGEIGGTTASKQVEVGNTGIFKYFPASPRGAIAARTVHMLVKDPRCNLNIIMIPAFYVLFTLFGRVSIGEESTGNPVLLAMAAVFVPAMAGYVYSYLISYENSAFSMNVLAPVSGKDDRWGRAWGLLVLMGPLIIFGSLFLSWRLDNFASLPAIMGLGVGQLLCGVGLSAFVDMLISVPAPPPGGSPFKTPKQSDGISKGLIRGLIMLVLMAFAIPGGILWIVYSSTSSPLWLWLSGAVSFLIGAIVFFVGLTVGAARYDAHSAETLQRVSQFR